MKRFPYLAAILATPLAAQEAPDLSYWTEGRPAVAEVLAHYAESCRSETDGGVLEVVDEERAFVEADLDGDAQGAYQRDDLVIDFNYIYCSRAASLWAGTGGAPIHFVLDGTVEAGWFGHKWELVRMGVYYPAILLVARHGSACDGAGVEPCVEAIVAANGRFYSVLEPGPVERP